MPNAVVAFDDWKADRSFLESQFGLIMPDVQGYMESPWKSDFTLAMDAQPTLAATTASAGIPAYLTTMIDPEVIRVVMAPLEGANIIGETKKGTWVDDTMVFPMVEATGEVSSYGDFNNNGRAGAVSNWPARQSYHFQVIIEYGDREIDRAARGKLNWVSELQTSAANALNRYQDLTYHLGVAGLQNYGLLNDPTLNAALTPITKAAGGATWVTSGGAINATANEVYADVQALYIQLVSNSMGVVDQKTPMVLVTPPVSSLGLTATNTFNVSVRDLLAKNFPNLTFETSIRYATVAGNVIQLIAKQIDGKDTGYCAFTEKMRAHTIVKDLSSCKQKQTSGTWGAIIRYPIGIAQMLGV